MLDKASYESLLKYFEPVKSGIILHKLYKRLYMRTSLAVLEHLSSLRLSL